MTLRPKQASLVALAVLALMALAFAWIATGTPLRWTKGIVIPESCAHVVDTKGYACEVELVPGGEHVTAQSDDAVAGEDWVELRVWRNMVSGTDSYTIVR